jgi:hypothetical protein
VLRRRVLLREWEDSEWRVTAGWVGSDLIHRPGGRGVQVLAYFWQPETLTLTGIARFGPDAESHRGLCHGASPASPAFTSRLSAMPPPDGLTPRALAPTRPHAHAPSRPGGAMTSLMDDLCGHICFVAAEAPWCGATVQARRRSSRPLC